MSDGTIGIIGGGILGLAIGRELISRRPGTTVVVFEKESRVATHQTGHNSGVVHAGLYYPPGSLKARLCTRGRELLKEYCAEHGLPYVQCGKLVVAVGPTEMDRFDALEARARTNGVPGLRRLTAAEIHEVEPHVTGLAALHSPSTATTDFVAVADSLAREIEAAGGAIRLSTPVTGIGRSRDGIEIRAGADRYEVDRLVVCAGLHADQVSRWADGQDGPRIVPFRGEYLAVRPEKRDLVRGMVYPVPDPRYPFLGVHFTRRVSGDLEIGPNAVLAFSREGYRRSTARWADLRSVATWPGFWRMGRMHWRTGVREVRGSLSVNAYLREARRYVPDIGPRDVVRDGAGVRAQAVDRDGSLVDDFRITSANGVTCLRNAPSPAATSCLAIAAYVVDLMESGS